MVMAESLRRFCRMLPSRQLRILAITAVGIAALGVVDGTLWKILPSPNLGYRMAIVFGFALLFGWGGLAWSHVLLLAYFSYFFGWRGAVFVEPLYLLSHTFAFVAARRLAGKAPWLSRERSTLAFLAGAILAPTIPAFLNGPLLHALGSAPRTGVPPAISSWLREGAATLAIAPALLVYGGSRLKKWVGQPVEYKWKPLGAWDVLALGLEVALWTATLWLSVHFKARFDLNVTYLTFLPPLAFTLYRGIRLAAAALAANAVIATTLWSQLHWENSLSTGDLRLLIAFYSLTILVLAAVVDERQRGKMEIDERKEAEAVLRDSEKRIRTFADSAPAMIWVSGLNKRCIFVSKSWLDFTGRTLEQEIGSGWADTLHPEDFERHYTAYASAFDCGSTFRTECRFRRVDGEYRWILVTGSPLYDDGEFTGYIGSCVDVTEQRLATERVQASEARLKHAQRLAKVGSFERHVATDTSYWSDEKLRIFGLLGEAPPDYAAVLSYVLAEDRQKVQESTTQASASAAPVEVEYRIIRPNGEIRLVRSILEGIRNEQGKVVRFVGATQDITDLRRAQEEAFARLKLETVGTLANGVAHDFNNILGGVLAQAELALIESAPGSVPTQELNAIRDAAIRGAQIVRELLTYAGTEPPALSHLNISQEVGEMLGLLKVSVSKRATIETDLAEGLPAVRANPGQISQLLMNLVKNASDAIGDQNGVIRVVTRCVTAGSVPPKGPWGEQDQVQIEVSDNGCGMPPEVQARVFEPFFSTKSMGRGIGLAVVDGIARSLGGAIQLQSELGKGTTIRILLPAADSASEAIGERVLTHLEESGQRRAITVLVVEDEEPLRNAVSKLLGKRGHVVLEAADGQTALDVIRSHRNSIDVVVLDITLPGASSREVFEEGLRLRPEVPVIVTSAYSADVAAVSLQAPLRHFLRKPYRMADLEALVQAVA
jgi:PAS domain S-box-containing protein